MTTFEDLGWTDEVGHFVETGELFGPEPVTTSRDLTYTFEIAGPVGEDTMRLWFGDGSGFVDRPTPTHSIVFDQEHTVSGEPSKPIRKRGLLGRIAHVFEVRKYRQRYSEWADAGFPDVVQKTRTYIPHARLTEVQ